MNGEAGHGLGIDQVTIFVAVGMAMTMLALGVVFGGFFAERRLHDRLEDLESRTKAGPRTIQMATLRRVDRARRLPTLAKLLSRGFPNATAVTHNPQLPATTVPPPS